jgi:hypothetical protein
MPLGHEDRKTTKIDIFRWIACSKVGRVLLLMLISMLLVSCQAASPADEADTGGPLDLVGIWRGAGAYNQFKSDGTYNVDGSVEGLSSPSIEHGRYLFDGTELQLLTDEDAQTCAATTGRYEVEVVEEGEFQLNVIEDPCDFRKSLIDGRPFTRHTP